MARDLPVLSAAALKFWEIEKGSKWAHLKPQGR
jgi:hypothetical protein